MHLVHSITVHLANIVIIHTMWSVVDFDSQDLVPRNRLP